MTCGHADAVATDDQLRRQKRLGARIKEARLGLRLTGEQLGALVTAELEGQETAGQSMVSNWESGRSAPRPAKLRALEKVLHLRRNELAATLDPERFSPLPDEEEENSIAAALEGVRRATEHLAVLVAQDGVERRRQSTAPEDSPKSSGARRSRKRA